MLYEFAFSKLFCCEFYELRHYRNGDVTYGLKRISVPDGLLVESKLYDKVFEKICNTTVTIRKYDRSFFCITSIDYKWFEDDYYDLNNLFDSLQLRSFDYGRNQLDEVSFYSNFVIFSILNITLNNFIKAEVEMLHIDMGSFDLCRKTQYLLEKVGILGRLFRPNPKDENGCYIADTKFLKEFGLMNNNSLENTFDRFKYFIQLLNTLQVTYILNNNLFIDSKRFFSFNWK